MGVRGRPRPERSRARPADAAALRRAGSSCRSAPRASYQASATRTSSRPSGTAGSEIPPTGRGSACFCTSARSTTSPRSGSTASRRDAPWRLAPFTADITAALRAGENSITICAEDDTRSPLQPTGKQSMRYESYGCFYTRTTGIWQTVWLEAVPEDHISKVRLTPDLESGRVLVEARSTAATSARSRRRSAGGGHEDLGEASAGGRGTERPRDQALDKARAWSPDDPFLYDLSLRLVSDGQSSTSVQLLRPAHGADRGSRDHAERQAALHSA